ncbi:MAG: hypothetical protein LOD90_08440, partial [Symbiobacteriaceae bacterium]
YALLREFYPPEDGDRPGSPPGNGGRPPAGGEPGGDPAGPVTDSGRHGPPVRFERQPETREGQGPAGPPAGHESPPLDGPPDGGPPDGSRDGGREDGPFTPAGIVDARTAPEQLPGTQGRPRLRVCARPAPDHARTPTERHVARAYRRGTAARHGGGGAGPS